MNELPQVATIEIGYELPPVGQEQPIDYLREYPNAVQDFDKAKVMAHASHNQEEAVVSARGLALEAASNIGNRDFRDSSNLGAIQSARHHVNLAKYARQQANSEAEQAAATYDEVKNL